jgi:heme-degrading monooxygenase HmoA
MAQTNSSPTYTFMIRHSVIFKLKHPKDSPAEKAFLESALKLSFIPGVYRFECLRQTSRKNHFDYGLSMEFDSLQAYEAYNKHPDHATFVQTYWLRDVEDFLEIDFEPVKQ